MFIVTHAAIGALIGEAFPGNPWVAFWVSFVVHFLTDLIPHGDTNLYKGYVNGTKIKKALLFIGVDVAATVFFIVYFFLRVFVDHRLAIVMGVVGGVLPDVLVAVHEIFHIKYLEWFHRLHFYFHNLINKRTGDLSLQNGMIMEIVLLSVMVYTVIP